MNKSILTQVIMLMLLATGATSAQEVNKLYFGDVESSMGQTTYVPVYLENTSTDITAVQFDIELPNSNIYFNNFSSSYITLNSERIDGHTVTVTYSGQKGRILLSSSANKPIRGNSGELLRFPVYLNTNLAVGENYSISISKVLMPNTAGENVVTESSGCSITIEGSPDFEVSDVSFIGVDSITPGDTLTYQYTVKNVGVKATSAGFTSSLKLNGTGGTGYNLSSISHNDLLEPDESITIVERVPLSSTMYMSSARVWPGISISGNSGSGELSTATGNNSTSNSSDTHILKTIYKLSPTEATWNESAGGSKYLYLYRYGNTSQTYEYFNVKIEKGDSRLTLTNPSVYFRYNSSTSTYYTPYLTINNDDIVNDDNEVVISFTKSSDTSIVFYGYYTLVDDEADGKTLKLTSSKTDVTEGESFTMTVTLPETATSDVTVNISYNNSSYYFVAPSSVTIPAGSQSSTFDVQTIDDEVVRSNTTITFTVTATNYVKGTRTINWKDNDNSIFSNIVDEEWELLKSIYQKANGANWNSNRWYIKETKEETGSLSGVSVINGHVTELALGNRKMNCELIPEFFMFPKLKTLSLGSNGLSGKLEDIFVNISEPLEGLTSFTIQDNNLTGNIGDCNLSVIMPALTTLNISNNQIRDITPALPSSITSLNFSGQTIDENIGSLTAFYNMTVAERTAVLPTIMTYSHSSRSYSATNYRYDILGEAWGFSVIWNTTPSTSSYSGYSPWNKLPSGQVLRFINDNNNNTVFIDFNFQQGDANFNDVVNLSDLQTIITFALQPEANQYKLFNFYAANLIEDDVVNVQDVVAHINLMLDKGLTPSFARRKLAKREIESTDNETTNCIYVEDGKLILKSDTPVAALDIILSSDNARWTEATSWFTKKQRGSRTIFYSLFGDEIAAGETILASFDGTIEDAMVVALDGTEIPLNIGINNADGIEALNNSISEELENATIYDLSGRKLGTQNSKRSLPRGVYIVNGKKQVIK